LRDGAGDVILYTVLTVVGPGIRDHECTFAEALAVKGRRGRGGRGERVKRMGEENG
jgi:hypothetical protein